MTHPCYTIGYTGRRPDDIKRAADERGALLVDIRFSPRSRVAHWDGKALERLVGLGNYRWLREFGNRNYRGGPVELVDPTAAIAALRPVLAERPVILLCMCADHRDCHRSEAASVLAAAVGGEVIHL